MKTMTNVIYVNHDKLMRFNEDLLRTPTMLENIFNENSETLSNTIRRIDMTADMLNRKKASVQMVLERAIADLELAKMANARNRKKISLEPYMDRIREANWRLKTITNACYEITKIKDGFQESAEQYFRSEERCFQDYNFMVKKGSAILEKYAELVRRSASVIPEGQT